MSRKLGVTRTERIIGVFRRHADIIVRRLAQKRWEGQNLRFLAITKQRTEGRRRREPTMGYCLLQSTISRERR
jgi:hypothetical protein